MGNLRIDYQRMETDVQELENEILDLRKKLQERETQLQEIRSSNDNVNSHTDTLTNEDILRYSRQMFVPAIGTHGQLKLRSGSVLIIGCGGLGCPAAQYLAGCGIGRLGLVDYDVVEKSNLHRQLMHSELTLGVPKVISLSQALNRINSKLRIDRHQLQLNSTNALDVVSQYDVVIDGSDNVATRYLVNDACVLAKKPLISGSAVGCEGQLSVYNYKEGPCYRCLFPSPPPPETVSNCSDVGVVGPVPGTIGVLQALQAIHLLTGKGNVLSQRLLLFDGEDTAMRTIKLRGKSPSCNICSDNPTITKLIDYEQFCGAPAHDKDRGLKVLDKSERVSSSILNEAITQNKPHVLIDVRSRVEFDMCKIPGSINIPLKDLSKEEISPDLHNELKKLVENNANDVTAYVICRRGNDSQLAVKHVKNLLPSCKTYDIIGGFHAWSKDIDSSFPAY